MVDLSGKLQALDDVLAATGWTRARGKSERACAKPCAESCYVVKNESSPGGGSSFVVARAMAPSELGELKGAGCRRQQCGEDSVERVIEQSRKPACGKREMASTSRSEKVVFRTVEIVNRHNSGFSRGKIFYWQRA